MVGHGRQHVAQVVEALAPEQRGEGALDLAQVGARVADGGGCSHGVLGRMEAAPRLERGRGARDR